MRAGMAKTPESSAYTSVSRRLDPPAEAKQLTVAISELLDSGELRKLNVPVRPLLGFAGYSDSDKANPEPLPISRVSYLELVDLTGRLQVTGKRGRIDTQLAPILKRLGLSNDAWLSASTQFEQHYRGGCLKIGAQV